MLLSTQDLNTLCSTAETAAREAGEYIQSQFDQHYDQKTKEGGNSLASQIVTEVDLRAQEIILEHLDESIQKYDLGLLTEEAADDSSRLEKDYYWCVDPMDGTLAFTEGRTGYAVSIALVSHSGEPLLGIVYIPDSRDCYAAQKGEGVRLNGQTFLPKQSTDNKVDVFMDASLQKESYFDLVQNHLQEWANRNENRIEYRLGFGAVRNAIGVMNTPAACYFKLPKKEEGGGSIWDFAASCLFFEELGLIVANSSGKQLYLNNSHSTFMNHSGVIYATDSGLLDLIISIGCEINEI